MTDIIHQYTKFLIASGLAAGTIRAYKADLNQLAQFLKLELNTDILSTITRTSLRFFLGTLHNLNISKRSVARKISSIKEFFKYCLKNNFIKNDPTRKLIYPKFSSKLPSVFTVQEMFDLIELPDTNTNLGLRDKAILEVMYTAGLRISELSKIKMQEVCFDSTLIKIHGKGNKDRYVPIGRMSIIALKNYLSIRKFIFPSTRRKDWEQNEYLFISKNGNQLSTGILRCIINGYISKIARTKDYTPHSIRHSFATHMLQNGANLRTVQVILGHENVSTTELYTQLSLNYQKEAYYKFHPLNQADARQMKTEFYYQT